MSEITPCTCGYGENWYCRGEKGGNHEYNTSANPCAQLYAERKPYAMIFGHLNEKFVQAYTLSPQNPDEKRFHYRDYAGSFAEKKQAAMQDAKQWVDDSRQQLGLFA